MRALGEGKRGIEDADGGVGDVVDDRAALAEHSDHELRRRGAVAAVVRPEKRVVVVELHVAKARHGSHRRIGCPEGEHFSFHKKLNTG